MKTILKFTVAFIKAIFSKNQKKITYDKLTETIGFIICAQKNLPAKDKFFEELQWFLHTYKGGYFELAQMICDKYDLNKDDNVKYFATCIYNFRIGSL